MFTGEKMLPPKLNLQKLQKVTSTEQQIENGTANDSIYFVAGDYPIGEAPETMVRRASKKSEDDINSSYIDNRVSVEETKSDIQMLHFSSETKPQVELNADELRQLLERQSLGGQLNIGEIGHI